jgi:4-carboxymuconolactone decarboxylase
MAEDKARNLREEWRADAMTTRARLHPSTGQPSLGNNPMADLDAEFATLVIDFALGGEYARPELDLKTRAMCTVAALIALGEEPYAANWIDNALNVGATREEIVALLRQLFFYIGTPRTVSGFGVAKAVFGARAEGRSS